MFAGSGGPGAPLAVFLTAGSTVGKMPAALLGE